MGFRNSKVRFSPSLQSAPP
jgi:beta-glucosidase